MNLKCYKSIILGSERFLTHGDHIGFVQL